MRRRTILAATSLVAVVVAASLLATLRNSGRRTPPFSEPSALQTLDAAGLREIRKTPDLHVAVETDPETGWNRGAAVVIGEDESLFVAQPRSTEIHVLSDAAGDWSTIGRSGEGPGEFTWIQAIGFVGDTLFASDPSQRRVTYFDANGRYLDSRRWSVDFTMQEQSSGLHFAPNTPWAIRSNELALVRPTVSVPAGSPRAGVSSERFRYPVFAMDGGGRILDTLAWIETAGAVASIRRRGSVFSVPVPFQRTSHATVAPSGSGVVEVRYETFDEPVVVVARIGATGDTVLLGRYEYSPVPLTDELLARAMAETEPYPGGVDGAPGGTDFEDVVRESGLLPETLPPVTYLAVGQDDSIWLRREDPGGEAVPWTVLDAAGEVLGFLNLPRTQHIVAARGRLAVALQEDELGRITLVRYRMSLP